MRRLNVWILIGVVGAGTLPALAADPATAPADKPATKAQRLAEHVKALNDAKAPQTAMAAYARGCAIDRNDAGLQNAYMRKMLKFGLPKIAFYAAQTLVRIEPDNGTAWGVMGYMHGHRGHYDKAFAACIRAAALAGDDPSVLHNAGQMVAWFDSQRDLPDVPDAVRRTLARIKPALEKKAPYAAAYKHMKATYATQGKAAAGLEKKLNAAEADAQAVQRLAAEIDVQLRNLNDDITYRNRLIKDLWREYRYGGYSYVWRTDDGRLIYYPNYSSRLYRAEILERIRTEERALAELKGKARQVRQEGNTVLAELALKRKALDAIRQAVRKAIQRAEQRFRWDPPAVDGVVTDEIEHLPPAPAASAPADPEAQAAQRLALAKLYLRHDMNDKAVEILRDILSNHPATDAARKAKTLLATLRPME